MKCTRIYFNFTVILFLYICDSYSTNPFDDTILYNIKWPGRNLEEIMDIIDPDNFEVGVTDQQERYVCFLPAEMKPKNEDSDSQFTEMNPIQLLKPMFDQSTCSYRLESYWAYEVCHGKFIKQYHEERDGKKMKRQEYYLGKLDATTFDEISANINAEQVDSSAIKTKKIEGMDIPYFQLNYTDGTLCDLNEKPRQTNVLYMCFNSARHDVYSIKEISTCLYEAIIFTPYLCSHPLYRPKNSAEKDINCTPFDQEPKKPTALMTMETESLKQKHEQLIDDDQVLKKVFAVFSFDKSDSQVDLLSLMDDELEGEARLHFRINPFDVFPEVPPTKALTPELPRKPDVNYDVASFLSGDNCLEDGKGWWKYQFCYGKHVIQYHEGLDGSKTVIRLGEFSLEDHRTWLENNPLKRPKKKSTSISHHYSKGSLCELTGNPRETEVRFKCIKESSASLSTIKLYMVEPLTCKYVLSVESPLFCKLIPHIDDDGMFRNVKISNDIEDNIEL